MKQRKRPGIKRIMLRKQLIVQIAKLMDYRLVVGICCVGAPLIINLMLITHT